MHPTSAVMHLETAPRDLQTRHDVVVHQDEGAGSPMPLQFIGDEPGGDGDGPEAMLIRHGDLEEVRYHIEP